MKRFIYHVYVYDVFRSYDNAVEVDRYENIYNAQFRVQTLSLVGLRADYNVEIIEEDENK